MANTIVEPAFSIGVVKPSRRFRQSGVLVEDGSGSMPGGAPGNMTKTQAARELVDSFLAQAPAEGVPHSAVIVVMSDGECQNPDATRQEAQRIKSGPNGSRVKICSSLFATVGAANASAEALLMEIASDPVQNYRIFCDANTLRRFFIA